MNNPVPILSIAGSDPTGGAGIQADIKSIMANGGYAMAIPTLITAQNTLGVHQVFPISHDQLSLQLESLLRDIKPSAIKIGALGNELIVQMLCTHLSTMTCPIVWDPILYSSSGTELISKTAISIAIEQLLPMCTLVTPNVHEVNVFSKDDLQQASFLITGGDQTSTNVTDTLLQPNQQPLRFSHPRYRTNNTHGTGCTLSSSIATYLGRGYTVKEACLYGVEYTVRLLETSHTHNFGFGNGSLLHEQHITPFRS